MMQLNLDKNKKYLLACSYGPDSMALFSLLLNQGYDFVVAHVNYHARSTSDEEQKGLESYCLKKDIPFEVLDFRTSIKRNFEETAREIRYDFFKELYEKHHVDYLLTGHQLDDHIETYYLQKQRKNLVNYYGIKSATTIKGMKVLRPLLNFEKKALQAYCDDNNIPYAIDQSNLQPIYERNKIRIDIVSKMTLEEKISVSKEIDDKNKELKRLLNKISKVPNDILSLKGLSNIKFAYYLFRQIRRINPNYEATYKFSLEVRKILDSNKPNVQINLKCGVVIEKEYDNLLIYKKGEFKGFDYLIINKCALDNEYFFLDFTGDTSNRNVKDSDYPLTIRTYQPGDKYQINDYQVLVRRLFIDWKMPMSLRKRWPLIVNKDGRIIYIPRYRKDFVKEEDSNFYVKSILL